MCTALYLLHLLFRISFLCEKVPFAMLQKERKKNRLYFHLHPQFNYSVSVSPFLSFWLLSPRPFFPLAISLNTLILIYYFSPSLLMIFFSFSFVIFCIYFFKHWFGSCLCFLPDSFPASSFTPFSFYFHVTFYLYLYICPGEYFSLSACLIIFVNLFTCLFTLSVYEHIKSICLSMYLSIYLPLSLSV